MLLGGIGTLFGALFGSRGRPPSHLHDPIGYNQWYARGAGGGGGCAMAAVGFVLLCIGCSGLLSNP